MGEYDNKIESFEAILKLHNEKKPFSLYDVNKQPRQEKSENVKPLDVISSVSRQLRELQRADCLKKRVHVTKGKPTEFLHINDINRRETQHINKFETQCVSDTQLIDIVDSVEALADVNKGIAKEFDTTFCQNNEKLDIAKEKTSNLYEMNQDYIQNSNVCKTPDEKKKSSERNDNEEKPCIAYDHIFDINTDVYKEFETSYCKTYNDNSVSSNKQNVDSTLENEAVEINMPINITKNESINVNMQDFKANSAFLRLDTKSNTEGTNQIEKCVNNAVFINSTSTSEVKEGRMIVCKIESEKCIKMFASGINDDGLRKGNDITQTFDEGVDILDSEEGPMSPVFEHFKPKTKLPLVFTLESFEKFESLAMPLIEENLDFETAKHLINSQIINNELVIEGTKLTLNKPEDIMLVDKCNSHLHSEDNTSDCPRNNESFIAKDAPVNKPNNSFEDEILFSSDEENDYLEHNNSDLPMTCPLKTCESPVLDLNKTMFVGFQTCSNKSIQVLKESFDKAKSIFDNIDKKSKEELSLTELVEIYDGNVPKNLNNNLVTKQSLNDDKTDCANINKDNSEGRMSVEYSNIDHVEAKFIGFKTANGKSINISEKALQNCKNVFKDIKEDSFVKDCEEATNCRKREFIGFKTANNKRIKLSEESLAKSYNIFKDIDLNFNNDPSKTAFESNDFNKSIEINLQYEKGKKIFIDDDIFHKNSHNGDLNIVDQTILQEFENDSIEESTPKNDQMNDNEFVGFKTASNKNIEVSITAMKKTEDIFKDIDKGSYENFDPGIVKNLLNKDIPVSKFVGFKTANSKEINISEKALAKTKDLFHDMDLDAFTSDFDAKENQMNIKYPISKCDLNQSESSKNKYMKILSEIDFKINKKAVSEMICSSDKRMSNFGLSKAKTYGHTEMYLRLKDNCFKTFKEPYPCISNNVKESLKEINKIDYHKHEPDDTKDTSSQELDMASETVNKFDRTCTKTSNTFEEIHTIVRAKDNATVEGNMNNYTKVLSNGDNIKQPCVSHFKTANNKLIRVSEEALTKTTKILENIDIISDTGGEDNNCDLNGKLEDADNKCDDAGNHTFQGFKTASNKNIEVSETALFNSRKIFEGIDNCKTTETNTRVSDFLSAEYEGFKTASKKAIHVPEKALLNAKNMFKDIDSSVEKEKCNEFKAEFYFQGFKTAGNKPVKVSEEALLKSKKIFQDINIERSKESPSSIKTNDNTNNYIQHSNVQDDFDFNKDSFKGFKTASNKQLKVTESALAKTKHIFKDLGFDEEVNLNEDTNKRLQKDISAHEVEEVNIKKKSNFDAFKGFQTASNKAVKISDEALAKSRKVFEDFNFDNQNRDEFKENDFIDQTVINKKLDERILDKGNNPLEFSFKTGTNKSISEDSLKKFRHLFADMDFNVDYNNVNDDMKSNKDKDMQKDNIENIDNILNTQVINNFEESLHTEDFYKDITPKLSKRSGSPILSCPKAKKPKKFETPYRKDNNTFKVQTITNNTKNSDTKYKFIENYKKVKQYTLNNLNVINQNNSSSAEIDPYILNFEFDTLHNFDFEFPRNDLTDVRWTTDNIKTCFIESVDRKIIPDGWLDNHLKLILWKLISYEIRFPHTMRGLCTVRNVLEQLKYRYDKELYNVERPALRKILEKDDVSTRTMVLAVVGVYVDGVKVNSVTNPSNAVELLLTDGWYCVKACLDRMLVNLVCSGRIAVGSKIATVGAELLNCEQGVSPWEDTTSVRLKLFGNSTRPARWDAKLGYHGNGTIATQLGTVQVVGGKVSRTRVLVVRVYPALHVERFQDGSTVTRSERLENLHQMKYETDRQMQLEKLYEEVEKEFFEQDSSEADSMDSDLKKSLRSSQINENMKSRDFNEFRSHLPDSQSARQDTSRRREKMLEALQKRVQERIQRQGLHVGRNVVTLLKIRVADFKGVDSVDVSKAMISIWRPNDAILDIVKEGTWIDIFNVVPTSVRNSEVQISAGRQSVFHRSKYKEEDKIKPYIQSLKRKCFSIEEIIKNPTMTTDFNEIDTIGVVFLIEPSTKEFNNKTQFQNVYLTDIDKNFICVNFWGGIKKFGYDSIFTSGNIVACSNLLKRAGNTRKSIPQYRATELSVFTESSKFENVRKMAEVMLKSFSCLDKRKFIEDCVLIKNNASIKYNTISPYRFNTSDHNFTKNKIFIDSPLTKDSNFNLTGLDFESSFRQSDPDLPPEVLKRKQKVNEKIAKLKMYGEPPPLSNMYILNKSKNAGSAYKSPLTSDVSTNVASVKNNDSPIINTLNIDTSPILSKNRFIRPVNPVKLNFSSTAGDGENNPFEEEFEASPPLSLD